MEDNLVIIGVHAMLFDNDSAAAFIESAEALVPWSKDEKVLMDRYDVRHLLQDANSVIQRRRAWSPCDISEEELDFERYRDLQEVNCAEPVEEKQNVVQTGRATDEDAPTASGYSSVPFDYGGDSAEHRLSPPASAVDKIEEPFTPAFPVPEHLQPHLPASQKIHQIISGTAKFVRERGGQAEIILKVKQANNPTFGFLMSDHIMHPYFRYLVDHPELTEAANKSPRPGNASVTKPAEGLRLLGEVYGVDEEDEDLPGQSIGDVTAQKPPLAALEIKALKEPPPNLKLVIDKMVEFIARNGKDFEDVVRDRDKSDERFHFLHPWHEYHPYYLRRRQIADQAKLIHRRRSNSESRSLSRHKQTPKSPAPSVKATGRHVSAKDVNSKPSRARSRFDVPPRDLPLSPAKAEDEAPSSLLLVTSEEGFNNTEQPGMSYDAAYAAVLAATRGYRKPKESSSGISIRKEAGAESGKADAKIEDIKAERLKRAKQLTESLRSEEQNDAQVPESADKHDDRHQHRRKRSDRDDEDRKFSEKRHRSDRKRHSRSPDARRSRHADQDSRKDKRRSDDKHYSNKSPEEDSDDIRAKVRAMLQQI